MHTPSEQDAPSAPDAPVAPGTASETSSQGEPQGAGIYTQLDPPPAAGSKDRTAHPKPARSRATRSDDPPE